ncbi:hypothetical protein TEQG_03022 [Trichophyton equinum CBS 127.97]|uniref:Uncharacterized protein n=1 Tax=Trichophyton equinum (strain ATCC MYA-4606 / CBS 127.97) TaxID=559882 RepID=F2PQ21_TRIEC|nr:hypothetical protein TEQG_03022 [Trichophyton equinum CBS 127.97]
MHAAADNSNLEFKLVVIVRRWRYGTFEKVAHEGGLVTPAEIAACSYSRVSAHWSHVKNQPRRFGVQCTEYLRHPLPFSRTLLYASNAQRADGNRRGNWLLYPTLHRTREYGVLCTEYSFSCAKLVQGALEPPRYLLHTPLIRAPLLCAEEGYETDRNSLK